MLGARLQGKRMGIVGMGRIGQALAKRARAFGLQVHYHNRRRVPAAIESALDATYWESLDQMLARVDIVSVNCPHTPATYHLLSARRLKLLKPEAVVVNTARGEVIDDPCPNCSGAGRVTRERTLSVNIPAGVEDGTRIRIAGEGEAGTRGGPAGDLYIFLTVKPHPFFQRDGADLYCQVPISFITAALGGEFVVPTIDGQDAKVKVPEGTASGKQFRLRQKGMAVLRSRDFGDLYIQVAVETPQNLTRRQRELLMEFDRESSKDTSPESSGFFARMREFFDGIGGAGRA